MLNHDSIPIIALFVDNLMFSVKIQNSAKILGYKVEPLESFNLINQRSDKGVKHQIAEHVGGIGFWLFDKLTKLQPALVIIDLGIENIQWGFWIASLKSAPATRRIPIICFSSHTHVESIKDAKKAKAELLYRMRFTIRSNGPACDVQKN